MRDGSDERPEDCTTGTSLTVGDFVEENSLSENFQKCFLRNCLVNQNNVDLSPR